MKRKCTEIQVFFFFSSLPLTAILLFDTPITLTGSGAFVEHPAGCSPPGSRDVCQGAGLGKAEKPRLKLLLSLLRPPARAKNM